LRGQPGLPKTYVEPIPTQHTETFARAANAALECEKKATDPVVRPA